VAKGHQAQQVSAWSASNDETTSYESTLGQYAVPCANGYHKEDVGAGPCVRNPNGTQGQLVLGNDYGSCSDTNYLSKLDCETAEEVWTPDADASQNAGVDSAAVYAVKCMNGLWNNDGKNDCIEVGAGKQGEDGSDNYMAEGASAAESCNEGFFNTDGYGECVEVDAGKQAQADAVVGSEYKNLGAENQGECESGTYKGTTGAGACQDHLAGYFTHKGGDKKCLLADGTYDNTKLESECQGRVGMWSYEHVGTGSTTTTGATHQEPCPTGWKGGLAGTGTKCVLIPVGETHVQ